MNLFLLQVEGQVSQCHTAANEPESSQRVIRAVTMMKKLTGRSTCPVYCDLMLDLASIIRH